MSRDEESLSVLLVEDDPDERAVMAASFAAAGIHVIAMTDGQQAFEHLLLHDELPSAIVLDLELPLMNGWEFLTLVRSYHRFASIAVVVVSTSDTPPVAGASEARTAHCRKPIDGPALIARVRALCARPEAD